MTSYGPNPFPSLLFALFAILAILLSRRREKSGRRDFTRAESWAWFNVVTLGTFLGYMISIFIGSIPVIGYWTITNLWIVLIFSPIGFFGLIRARGKKIKESPQE